MQDLRSEDIYDEKMDSILIDKVSFWKEVGEMQNALGEQTVELSEFAILSLTLPIRNAIVERVFSVMNTVKSKLRNRMGTQILNSILDDDGAYSDARTPNFPLYRTPYLRLS